MVSRNQMVVCWMLLALFFILGVPPCVQAESPEAPVGLDNDFSGMVKIPAGRFRMGLSFKQSNQILEMCTKVDKTCTRWWFKDEMPDRFVDVNSYWIDAYEVTNEKYLEFVKATGHRPALDDTWETDACWQILVLPCR